MAIHIEGSVLFAQGWLSDALDNRAQQVRNAIFGINADELLHRPSDKVIFEILDKYRFPKVCLDRNRITAPPVVETSVDRGNFRRDISNIRSANIPAARISLRIPYSGPSGLFQTMPDIHTSRHPHGHIDSDNSIVVSCLVTNDVLTEQSDEAIANLYGVIDNIEKWLGWINEQLDEWEIQLRAVIETAVTNRRSALLEMRNIEVQLGVPIERDDAVAETYAVPVLERRQAVKPVARRTYEPFEPEPCISEIGFGNIITDIGKVLAMFERLAVTHIEAKEERLRDQIIVQLHSIYDAGSAETFSKRGKTDIYLPWNGHAVFIAECKWWKGPKVFENEVLPQLLDRYIVWRDTHAAIILFIRNRNVSSVIDRAIGLIKQHPRFVADAPPIGEVKTFMLHKNGDEDRQLRLALLTAPIQVN